jgi:hypothetical protein
MARIIKACSLNPKGRIELLSPVLDAIEYLIKRKEKTNAKNAREKFTGKDRGGEGLGSNL